MKPKKTCIWCGKVLKSSTSKFCSRKCEDALSQNELEIRNPKLAYIVDEIKKLR